MVADTCDRARAYARGVLDTLRSLRGKLSEDYSKLVDASERYAEDSLYYVEKGDCDTALAAASYAEGLIDSLKYLNIIEPKWESRKWDEPIVFVAGTFDIIHPGHIELLKYASQYGRVHVVIARDTTIRNEKNKEPILDEKARLTLVSSIRYVYKAFLGDPYDKLRSVDIIKPDVIVLGPDQPFDEERLSEIVLRRTGKRPRVVRFPGKISFSGGLISTSDIVRKICRGSYCSSIQ